MCQYWALLPPRAMQFKVQIWLQSGYSSKHVTSRDVTPRHYCQLYEDQCRRIWYSLNYRTTVSNPTTKLQTPFGN
jgi:hypothetical protein